MPTYGTIISQKILDIDVPMFLTSYKIPNVPATDFNYAFNFMASAMDKPVAATSSLFDAGNLYTMNGLQLRLLSPDAFKTMDIGATVDSSNFWSNTRPAGAAIWNGKYAGSLVRWNGGLVYAKSGATDFPSTQSASPYGSTMDVLGFADGTALDFAPSPVRWQGRDYFVSFAQAPFIGDARSLLTDITGSLQWKTIWSGGDPVISAGFYPPLWSPDTGTGFNHAFCGGQFGVARPSIIKTSSHTITTETFNHIVLDNATYDLSFRLYSEFVGASQPYGQIIPEGFLITTDAGYFILLSPDGTQYSIFRPIGATQNASDELGIPNLRTNAATFSIGSDRRLYMMQATETTDQLPVFISQSLPLPNAGFGSISLGGNFLGLCCNRSENGSLAVPIYPTASGIR